MMAPQETYLTTEGRTRLQAELEGLQTVRRREVAEQLKKAAEVGGTVDNAEYDEAKRDQDAVERRIQNLETLLHNAVMIPDHRGPSDTVQLGSKVEVVDQGGNRSSYTIVGSAEADPLHGKISNESPVGRAVLGKRAGAKVEARAPVGAVKLTIVSIQ
jgi:transcription elongation factor GreA